MYERAVCAVRTGRAVLRAAGDRAVVAEYGDEIDTDVHRRVLALTSHFDRHPSAGLLEAIPTYRSVLIRYEPEVLRLRRLIRLIREAEREIDRAVSSAQKGDKRGDGRGEGEAAGRLVEVPTSYGGEHGPDLDHVARRTGFSPAEVVERHASVTYRVYMLGFMPGFSYLGDLPPALAVPRLPTPRVSVPAGSVGIGGVQTGIYSLRGPGGWRVIGRTSMRLWRPDRDPPAALRPGDRVRFVPV